jgi:transposase-like protein
MLVSTSPTVSIRHSAEFKTRVVKACERPGASIAAIALTNGVNTDLVHRWIRERRNGVIWADGNVRNYVLHSDEYKRAIVAQCRRAGVSITGVAYSHGLRPALVHKWIEAERRKASLSRFAPSPTEDWLPVVVSEESAAQGTQSRSKPALPAAGEAFSLVLEISGARLAVPVDRENFLDTLRVILEHLK